ncbi:AzlC family ABC transporter permease [Dactylosporangium sp. CA-233914]|uniref:AzlC family ABC transporter permease n=1 Tax=Dactylosporangium sp. CA-233914 TaxID=3239934 RepID=UPI003D8A30E0
MAVEHERHMAVRAGWARGLRVGIGLAAGAFLLAVGFGAFAVTHGWPPLLAIVTSAVVFSGSAQFALVTALAGGGLGPALTSAALMNLRFVPMAAATARFLPGGPLRRAAQGQAVVDGSWVAAQRPGGGLDRHLMFGATLVQWPAWILGTALGALLVPGGEALWITGLDVIFPGFFGLLLYDSLRARPRLAPAGLAAAVIAATCRFLPPGIALTLAAVAAALALHPSARTEERP